MVNENIGLLEIRALAGKKNIKKLFVRSYLLFRDKAHLIKNIQLENIK